jgi:hypothetical protein
MTFSSVWMRYSLCVDEAWPKMQPSVGEMQPSVDEKQLSESEMQPGD